MGAERGLLCDGEQGPDCKVVDYGQGQRREDLCGSSQRRQCELGCCPFFFFSFFSWLSFLFKRALTVPPAPPLRTRPQCLSFHPNSLYLATGSSDRTCRLWDVQKGHCVRVFIGHRAAVQVVKVSPDGRYLASAGDDGLILLWSLATGQRVKTFWGHLEGATIQSLSWSCESTVLVSGGSDETVRVWDVATPPSSWSAADGNGLDGGGGVIGSLSSLSTGGKTSAAAGV